MSDRKKTVSLVLGSGGARGLAHIGIIKWLEEHGYEINSVSGSSIGALVGGIYAAGKLDEYDEWVSAITKIDIISLLDFSFSIDGFVKGDKLINTLKELIGENLIEDLPIRFTAVATDLEREKEVWISTGPLFDAIRASISMPLLFTPFNYHGTNLIDGGVLNPVPISPTLHDRTDLTIAVNLNGPHEKALEEKPPSTVESSSFSPLHEKITQFIANLTPSKFSKNDSNWGMYYIAHQCLEVMQGAIARQKLAAYPPDVLIDLPRNSCRTLEFDRAKAMIALGYKKAQEHLSHIE